MFHTLQEVGGQEQGPRLSGRPAPCSPAQQAGVASALPPAAAGSPLHSQRGACGHTRGEGLLFYFF